MTRDTPIFPLKKKERPPPPSKFSDPVLPMNTKRSMEPITMEFSERTLNGKKMDQEHPLPSMPSISDFLDTTCTTLKPIVIWLFWEPLLFTTFLPPKTELLLVSALLMMKMMDGLFALLMMNPLEIGSAPFLKSSASPALPKKKSYKKKSFTKFNPC